MRARDGFTLVELLVVIAIIAILVAIIFPVYANARERARQTTCTSNIRQLIVATLEYAKDNDSRLPGAWAVGSSGLWSARIMTYCKNDGIFQCPSSRRFSVWPGWDQPGTPRTQYGWNCNISAKALCRATGSISRIKRPSDVILIGDIADTNWDFVSPGGADGRINPIGNLVCSMYPDMRCLPGGPSGARPASHSAGANFAFVDGHAKWRRSEQLYPSSHTDASKDQYWGG